MSLKNMSQEVSSEETVANATKTNYLASVHFRSRISRLTLKSAAASINDDRIMETVEEPNHLITEQDVFADYRGEYLRYSVEAGSKLGDEEIERVLLQGKVFSSSYCPVLGLKGFCGIRFFVSRAVASDGHVTFFMTPHQRVDLVSATGWADRSTNRIRINKRQRRAWSNGQLTLKGEVISVTDGTWAVSFGEEVSTIPMKIYTVRFTRAHAYAKHVVVNGEYEAKIGVLQIGKDAVSQKLLAMTDGGHVIDTERFMKGLGDLDIPVGSYPNVKFGDGAAFTFNYAEGQSKGNAVFFKLADLDILCCDVKREFATLGNRVRLSLNAIHKPGLVKGDIQTYINGYFEKIGLYYKAGRRWIASVAKAFQSDAYLCELLGVVVLDDESKEEAKWVIREFLKLTKKNLCDRNGMPLRALDFPGLAKKIFRHLTEQFMDINRFRIPLPSEWAVAGYAMFDISVLIHDNADLNFRGFYFNTGTIPAVSACLHRRTDLGHGVSITSQIESDAVLHRQPSGTGLEWVRGVRLTSRGFYENMHTSPYLFMSTKFIELDDEATAYITNCLGIAKLEEIKALWGLLIPTNVIWLAIMGGGDNDDRVIAYHADWIVEHLNNLYADLASYPQPDVSMYETEEPADVVPDGGEFDSMLMDRIASIAQSNDPDYEMVKTATKGGMIGSLSTAAFFLNYAFYTKRFIGNSRVGGFCRHLETVVDFEKMGKGGNIVAQAREAIEQFYAAMVETPDFLSSRVPERAKTNNPGLMEYETETGHQIKQLKSLVTELGRKFRLAYVNRDPKVERHIDFLRTCPTSKEARSKALEIRREFNNTVRSATEAIMTPFAHSKFNDIREQLSLQARVKAVQEADLHIQQLLDINGEYTEFQKEVAIELYKLIMARKTLDTTGMHGKFFPVSDGQLFAPIFSDLFAEAIMFAHARFFNTSVTEDIIETREAAAAALIDDAIFDTL